MGIVHVHPRGDLIDHDLESGDDCVCGPDVEFLPGGSVITHHPLDDRERHPQYRGLLRQLLDRARSIARGGS